MNIEQFRTTRASELKAAARVLESILPSSVNTSPIYIAANKLESESPRLKDGSTSGDLWGYEIEDFKMPVETLRHVRPKGIRAAGVELSLNMKLVADFNVWNSMRDPFLELDFNASIRGISDTGSHSMSFHIDKHDMSRKSDEPHPIYHLQYSSNPDDDEHFVYGSTLSLDTPRIMHHPIEFVLGVGFLAANFLPFAYNHLFDDGYFHSIYTKYQESILKPYFQTLASHWAYDRASIVWSPVEHLCPFLSP